MLPTSHLVPMKRVALDKGQQAAFLADAFSEFINASSRLEFSYRELQQEVTNLRLQLQDRDRANEEMRIRLRHILDSLPCGVIVNRQDHSITLTNPEAQRLLQLISESGLNAEQILSGMSKLAGAEDSEKELPLGREPEVRWIAIRRQHLAAMPESELVTVDSAETIFILRDITEEKHLMQERERARNSVALAEMSTVLAHEIRNPLASMELFAGLILEQPQRTRTWISHLHAGIRSLASTVNNVLSFYGSGAPMLAPLVVRESIRAFAEFVRPIADERSIRLQLDEIPLDLRIAADENSIQQVFLNLALNSFRHTQPGGELHVRAEAVTRSGQQRICISFADTGCGIAHEHLHRIFEPGFSVDGHSVGLGLSVCRRIMQQMGGTLTVSSRPNVGTVFYLEFPAK